MNANNDSIDIESVVKQVRLEIEKEHLPEEILAFEAIDPETSMLNVDNNYAFSQSVLDDRITECESVKMVDWYRDIEGNAISIFGKKLIRRLNMFLLDPLARDQTRFNDSILCVANQLCMRCEEQERRIVALQSEINELKNV